MRRLLGLAFAALVAAACAVPATTPTAKSPPRLVVVFVIDGFPQHQVLDYRDQLASDGFARFLDRGAWFADAHQDHAFTLTAPGHAAVLTGAYPHRTGIIGNDWRNRDTGEVEYCTGDPAYTYIGHKTDWLDGTSPKNLKVETLGDVLRGLDPASKVIAISMKDRAAILTAGHKGVAYIYRPTGHFASTTYYMKAHPKWVDDFNAAEPADRYFHQEWRALLPESAYARSLADDQAWFYHGGHLPRTMGAESDKPDARFHEEIIGSPFSDRLTLDFARAAIAGESLGQDRAPDILVVSLSGHDSVNHMYSAESRMSHDHTLQLDRALQDFFRDLDARVGRDNYVAVLTADHGFMPAPERAVAQGHDAGRTRGRPMLERLDAALDRRFGDGKWVVGFSADTVLLNRTIAAQRGLAMTTVVEFARDTLAAEPAIAVAYTRAELEAGTRGGAPYFEQMRRSFDPERSGDVQIALKPYWIFSSGSSGTTHGSPYPYDTHVPMLFYGPAWVRPGRHDERAAVVDIAPTLARILGVAAPAASEGKARALD